MTANSIFYRGRDKPFSTIQLILFALISAVIFVLPFISILTYLLKKPEDKNHQVGSRRKLANKTGIKVYIGYFIVFFIYASGAYVNFVIAAALPEEVVINWTRGYIISLITN